MDESFKTQLILAARTGKLTDEQYELYLRLLEEDPAFRELADWEDFLEENLAVGKDAGLYEALDNKKFEVKRTFLQNYSYGIAASIVLLLVTGWLVYQFGFQKTAPEMMGSRMIELYNGEQQNQGQLGFTEGGMPAGEVTLKWWKAPDQAAKISYRFCARTLNLYVQDTADTLIFNKQFKLEYLPKTEEYFLKTQDGIRVPLLNCSDIPNPVLK